jgi:hypothetical protein
MPTIAPAFLAWLLGTYSPSIKVGCIGQKSFAKIRRPPERIPATVRRNPSLKGPNPKNQKPTVREVTRIAIKTLVLLLSQHAAAS